MRMSRSHYTVNWIADGYSKTVREYAQARHWGFPIPETEDEICDDDLCVKIGLKLDVFEHIMNRN